jgi:hypothetical protein
MKTFHLVIGILLLLCLLPMPYGYFMLVRFISCISFIYFAYQHYQQQNKNLMFIFGALALLFQPFFKISLGRTVWNIVDVAVAIFLLVLVFTNKIEK